MPTYTKNELLGELQPMLASTSIILGGFYTTITYDYIVEIA